jgi:hypothetical protein
VELDAPSVIRKNSTGMRFTMARSSRSRSADSGVVGRGRSDQQVGMRHLWQRPQYAG